MLRSAMTAATWIVLIGSLAVAVALWRGDESFGMARLWERLAGAPDLGPVDFGALTRSPTGNDALFCPPDLCGQTPADGVAPVFAVPAARLRDAVRVIEVNDPDIFALARDDGRLQDRYLARTRLMRFPDTVNVRFVELGPGRSTLALHSRSQIGHKDFGANRARLEDWIAQLKEKLPVAQP